jgi:hypothetical protein
LKKVLLAAVVIFLLVLVGGVGFGYYYLDANVGLTESASVTYEEMLDENTRFIAMIQPDLAIPFLEPMLPVQSSQLPAWLPWGPIELLRRGVPREVSLLAGSARDSGRIPFTVFVNERLGGPLIAQQTGAQPFFLQPGAVLWDDPPVKLPKRGQLEARGSFALSPAVLGHVTDLFSTPKQGVTIERITRDHLFEAVLDNREGDFLAFVGMMAEQNGQTLDQVLADPNVAPMLTKLQSGRLTADITGPDEATIVLSLAMVEGTPLQTRLAMLFAANDIAFPQIQAMLAEQGLTLNLKNNQKADFKGGALIGNYTLSGFRDRVQAMITANVS